MKHIDQYIVEAKKNGSTNKPIKNAGFGEITEIDIAYDNVKDEFEFILDMASNGVLCNRTAEYGPGGGNPTYQMVPVNATAQKYLQNWLVEEYCGGDEDWAKDEWSELF